MRKALIALLSILLMSSCATYTVQQGRNNIFVPESSEKLETRYSVIKQRKEEEMQAEDARRRAEEDKKALEKKAAEEAEAKELERLRAMDVNDYPDDLSAMTYPHIYSPLKSNTLKSDDSVVTLSMLFIPLGGNDLTDENIASIIASISDNPDLIALTGSLSNQVRFAKSYKRDSVTLKAGTLIFNARLNSADESHISLQLTEKKDINVIALDYSESIPWSKADIKDWISQIKGKEQDALSDALNKLSSISGKSLLFLSSLTPSTQDWQTVTGYSYRVPTEFTLSDALSSSWQDVYRATHFNAELDPGITRRSYEVFERMDFIYSLSLMPLESRTMPIAGLTENTGNLAIFANIVIPD